MLFGLVALFLSLSAHAQTALKKVYNEDINPIESPAILQKLDAPSRQVSIFANPVIHNDFVSQRNGLIFHKKGTQRTLPTLDTPAADISSGRC